jgi:DNA primase
MAKMVSKRVLDDIRFRCDIVDLIGSYLTLSRAGGAFKALCPFHKEKTPSFSVNPQRQIFHCFGCGAGGDVFGFVMQHEGVPFTTAVQMLADRAGIKLELEDDGGGPGGDKQMLYRVHEGVSQFFQRCLQQTKAAEGARRYLESRALPPEAIRDFQIGYAPDRWDSLLQWGAKHEVAAEQLEQAGLVLRSTKADTPNAFYDRFRNRLMFPIRDEQARVIGFSGRALEADAKTAKYVNSPETPLFKKSRILYALDRARRKIVDAGEAIVCEGQIDVIRCHVAGFEHAVAAQGTAFTDDHARILKRYADSVILVFDPDTAGQDASIRAAGIFMKAGLAVRIATLPPKQDPDAFIRARGADAFRVLLEQAVSVVNFQIDVLSGRQNARSDVGAMRISKAVLQTVAQSPNAVLRAKLVQEAAGRLGLPASALLDDLRFVAARENRTQARAEDGREAAAAAAAASAEKTDAPPPGEEVELCEHLVHLADEPELGELVPRYLPLDVLSNAACQTVAQACLDAAREGAHLHAILESGPDVDPDLLRFAAAIQSAPSKVRGRDMKRADAVRDLILRIWKRELRAQRTALEQSMKADPNPELMQRRVQLTLDLDSLKSWADGAPVIEMELAHRQSS